MMDSHKKTVTIVTVIDIVGALTTRSLDGVTFLFDDNRRFGSDGLGTASLRTKVRAGDTLVWTTFPLEVEAFVGISEVVIAPAICKPERRRFPGSDIIYWQAIVLDCSDEVPYQIKYFVGDDQTVMSPTRSPFLIP
jgi:hypothetical protein